MCLLFGLSYATLPGQWSRAAKILCPRSLRDRASRAAGLERLFFQPSINVVLPFCPSLVSNFGVKIFDDDFSMSAEVSEQQDLATLLEQAFSKEGQIEDAVFNQVTSLLCQTFTPERNNPKAWAERPRLYAVLQRMGAPLLLDKFVEHGLDDMSIPYTADQLPPVFQDNTDLRNAFSKWQTRVLSKPSFFSSIGSTNFHLHAQKGDLHFKQIRFLGRGAKGEVDLVHVSLTEGSESSLRGLKSESNHVPAQYARKKILRTEPGKNSFDLNKERIKLAKNERRIMHRLNHEHLVKLVGSYTDEDHIGLILSPVAKTDLKTYLTDVILSADSHQNRITVLRSFFGCLTDAVSYLHAQNIRHRDVKPENILVNNGKAFLCDFGISREFSITGLTTNGSGTPRYRAPEIERQGHHDEKSDVWSLGCVFVEMWSVIKGEELSRFYTFMSESKNSWIYSTELERVHEWVTKLQTGSGNGRGNEPWKWIKTMV